jgi:signal peptidase II
MQNAGSPPRKWWYIVIFITVSLVATADQLTKLWVRSFPEGHVINELAFLRLTHVQNTGAVFGLFQDQSFILTIIALVGVALILLWSLFMYRSFPLLTNIPNRIALGLMLGGAVGNLIDRISRGYVTDFIDFRIWPAFNIADSAIVIGVIIVVYYLLRMAIAQRR